MYDAILVPTDGSEISARAAAEAFGLARAFGATVHVLFVVDESASSFLLASDSMSGVLDALRTEGEEAVEAIAAEAGDLDVRTNVVRGMTVHGAIVDYATDNGIDLIVMGTHGRRGVEHLLGSTTERALTAAAVPVLVVDGEGA